LAEALGVKGGRDGSKENRGGQDASHGQLLEDS